MDQLSTKEIQAIELNILKSFHNHCEENDYRYSLGGGTLLGAIRHHGFIPWDDDIDVMMPRPDYDRFLRSYINNPDGFKLISYENEKGYHNLFAKISDPSTVIEDEYLKLNYDLGINIDVFPIDGLGDSEKEANNIFNKTVIDREILDASLWKHYFRSKTHSIVVEPIRLLLFIISRFADAEKILDRIDQINRTHLFDNSQYAGCVCGSYRKNEIMKTETFLDYIDVPFEGNYFQSIRDYDLYLAKHYGDYMILPSEDKRITHHTFIAYKKG